ncbi:hypothetical protein EVAR_59012_1 [Eumeta japonica]|uniref:Uncharacterized protein n=1 Tax=Eumeta variegata TaxID=151549 RepID=A0A4C1ZN25_EUMVA|nr:hypothetical protein EVAR_59012_1 [Eumeta japonica]
MALKNLQLLKPLKIDMQCNKKTTPMKAPPSAISRSISKSAENLIASTRYGENIVRNRKSRSTEQPNLVKGTSTLGLPALGRQFNGRDTDSYRSGSRNGSYPIRIREAGNPLMTPLGLRIFMSSGDHLISDGLPIRSSF